MREDGKEGATCKHYLGGRFGRTRSDDRNVGVGGKLGGRQFL